MDDNKEKRKISKVTATIIAVLLIAVIALIVILVLRNPSEQEPQSSPTPPPTTSELSESLKSPTDLSASSITATKISLGWRDNSVNENGIRVYRNGVVIADLPENTTIYEDKNLQPATDYTYKVEVYNSKNQLESLEYSAKTLNPPINVWIDKIGVHDNGEDLLRGDTGEVNVGIVISDTKNTVQIRLPSDDYYKLKADESVSVEQKVFSASEVGEGLKISIIGYENDGGNGEQFIYDVMGTVVELYIPGAAFLELANIDLSTIISNLFGGENDWLGSYASENTASQNWGIGNYVNISCKNKDGDIGIIVSFRIECPVFDYSR